MFPVSVYLIPAGLARRGEGKARRGEGAGEEAREKEEWAGGSITIA